VATDRAKGTEPRRVARPMGRVARPMAKTAIVSGAQPGDTSRGDDPPYPPKSALARGRKHADECLLRGDLFRM
jgi:hypothetical protein